jgi:hypothetical protein
LSPHQGFVASSGCSSTELPRTFIPWFEDPNRPAAKGLARSSSQYLEYLLRVAGLEKKTDPDLFCQAAMCLCRETAHAGAVSAAREFFRSRAVLVPEGLERLPTPWLLALPPILWSTRKPHWIHLPYMLSGVEVARGLLLLRFAQEDDMEFGTRITVYDRLRVRVNASLYPSLYRPLKQRDLDQLKQRHREVPLDGASPEFDTGL